MKFVYMLQSVAETDQFYTGLTYNINMRLDAHNAGRVSYTSKFKPWKIISYTAFANEKTAVNFEKYLKSGSGRAFAAKRLRG